MKKELFKTKFRAIINVRGVEQAFAKSADTAMEMMRIIRNEEFSNMFVRLETFDISTEKRRGKHARKY
jgi:hypothetical protein